MEFFNIWDGSAMVFVNIVIGCLGVGSNSLVILRYRQMDRATRMNNTSAFYQSVFNTAMCFVYTIFQVFTGVHFRVGADVERYAVLFSTLVSPLWIVSMTVSLIDGELQRTSSNEQQQKHHQEQKQQQWQRQQTTILIRCFIAGVSLWMISSPLVVIYHRNPDTHPLTKLVQSAILALTIMLLTQTVIRLVTSYFAAEKQPSTIATVAARKDTEEAVNKADDFPGPRFFLVIKSMLLLNQLYWLLSHLHHTAEQGCYAQLFALDFWVGVSTLVSPWVTLYLSEHFNRLAEHLPETNCKSTIVECEAMDDTNA